MIKYEAYFKLMFSNMYFGILVMKLVIFQPVAEEK